jgi:MoaA/NifB/PqqE/SkfB family radical SAM enzyme
MHALTQPDWRYTRAGEPRGYIEASSLQELWFHTGTACNLACPFCLEGSKPGDTRLQLVKFDDVWPYVDEAAALGVRQFSFTGGEPFLAKDLPMILAHASQHAPCLVLTNGTRPLLRRLKQIEPLLQAPHPVSFRVSLDYPERERHDEGRGAGQFDEAMRGLVSLNNLGFRISVARQWSPDEDSDEVADNFRRLFREHGLPEDLTVTWFPDFHPPGSHVETPKITESCMTQHHTADSRAQFMCAYSRMVVKINDRMRVYACTLVDDDADYDLGDTLAESLQPRVMLRHHRCYSCFRFGASCSEK